MATTPTYINQRINNLQAQINSIISGGVPTTSDLAVVLGNGNSAGTFDIDLNINDILNGNQIGCVDTPNDATSTLTGFSLSLNGVTNLNSSVLDADGNLSLTDTVNGSILNLTPDSLTLTNAIGVLTIIPSNIIQSVSNTPIAIPPFTNNPHQVILQSSFIPVIDTFDLTGYSLGASEIINVILDSGNSGTNILFGCDSGRLYQYDGNNNVVNLVATFDGAIYAIWYEAGQAYIHIGGAFSNCVSTSQPAHFTCYFDGFNYSNAFQLTFTNYGVEGFNSPVHAITGDINTSFIYYGGAFTDVFGGVGGTFPHFAIYDNNATTINNLGGIVNNGFNNPIYAMDYLNITGILCVCGTFTSFDTSPTLVNYCVGLEINGTTQTNQFFLEGNPFILSTPINYFQGVKAEPYGVQFVINTNNSSLGASGANYLLRCPLTTANTISVIGGNQYGNRQGSFAIGGTIQSIDGTNVFFDGTIGATIPFLTGFIYFNNNFGRFEIVNQADGLIYFFNGNLYDNIFTLQGGRTLNILGTTFNSGWKFSVGSGNGLGYSVILLWNGTSYNVVGYFNGFGF